MPDAAVVDAVVTMLEKADPWPMTGLLAPGARLAVRNCLFVLLDGGRITRVEEYVDPTFGSQLGVSP